jgi:uncharacterized protein YlzI (FlbEa/FlbD family)
MRAERKKCPECNIPLINGKCIKCKHMPDNHFSTHGRAGESRKKPDTVPQTMERIIENYLLCRVNTDLTQRRIIDGKLLFAQNQIEELALAIKEFLRKKVEGMMQKRLPDGNVLPNIGNMPIDIHNQALQDVMKEIL